MNAAKKSVLALALAGSVFGPFAPAGAADPSADRIQAGVDGADVAVKELQKFQQVNGKIIQVLTEEILFVEKVGLGE